nr:ABC transporter ATP-binding protein [uncultured Stomatobaculum sp.]
MLEIENFWLSYGEGEPVLKDISLTLKAGECLVVTGESGSGKSSLIHAINGLAFHYNQGEGRGHIRFEGESIETLPIYQIALRIASVFQNPKTHFFNVNTTLELLFYMENMGLNRAEMDRRMEDLLKIFPIEHLLGRNIFALSGGEKQILSVAACYLAGCKLIVMDEPSSNLDEASIAVLQKMLPLLKEKGIALLIAEHRLHYLTVLMDRLIILEEGRIDGDFSREAFLTLSEEALAAMGLRSREKPVLRLPAWKNEGELTVETLCCPFRRGEELKLSQVSFSFGKIFGIIGENGCGKSTLLRAMTGLATPKKSRITLRGKPLSGRERIARSALVMQDVNSQLFADSVEEELRLAWKGRGLREKTAGGMREKATEEEIQRAIENLLHALGLSAFRERHPMSLSGGQKQRLALATCLLQDADFFYFDEPTSGMDRKNMLRIAALLKQQQREDRILFVVSHDTAFLQEVATECLDLELFRKRTGEARN